MPFVPKVPDSCAHLDLALVARVLAKHHAYFPAAARELGVLPADLNRLTWARPHVLDEAHEEMEVVVARAQGEMIQAVYSDDPRRQMWARTSFSRAGWRAITRWPRRGGSLVALKRRRSKSRFAGPRGDGAAVRPAALIERPASVEPAAGEAQPPPSPLPPALPNGRFLIHRRR